MSINGYPYTVIGLMSEKNQNSSYDGWDNDKILIPQSSLLRDCPPTSPDCASGARERDHLPPRLRGGVAGGAAQVRGVLGTASRFRSVRRGRHSLYDTIEGAELFDRVFDATEIFLAGALARHAQPWRRGRDEHDDDRRRRAHARDRPAERPWAQPGAGSWSISSWRDCCWLWPAARSAWVWWACWRRE